MFQTQKFTIITNEIKHNRVVPLKHVMQVSYSNIMWVTLEGELEHVHANSNDDDFIGDGLGGMGYSCRSYEMTIPNCKFIRGWFQIRIFKK